MSLFLTRDELQEFSECHHRSKVIAWLTQAGYKFEIAADGWPKVLRAAVEARLLPAGTRRTLKKTEPDFSVYGQTEKAA